MLHDMIYALKTYIFMKTILLSLKRKFLKHTYTYQIILMPAFTEKDDLPP